MAIEAKKYPMPTQEAGVRVHNFDEVALGYPVALARQEAARCLNCKNRPCVQGCPVNIQIPDFIAHIKVGDYEGAYQVIAQDSALPAVCGRVCPQESQCESKCTLGVKLDPVAIGRLERFAADWHLAHHPEQPERLAPNGHRVAVVGSGPSGLTCAGELARRGYQVTVFEALHAPGGVLSYGIPEFRLPKAIVAREVENLRTAYERTLEVGASSQSKMSQQDYELYGTYIPFSMAVCHTINHKSGMDHTTYAHTGAMVNVYAMGVGAEKFGGVYDNTEIYHKLAELTKVQ